MREIRNVEGTGMGVDYAGSGYTYDRLGRLRAESTLVNYSPPASCDGGMIVDEYGNSCVNGTGWVATAGTTFSYDAVGNRTDRGGTYTTGNRITAFDGCSYTTDADGNVTSRAGACVDASFTWTAEGRLASLAGGGQTYTFHYDAAGRLVRRDVGGVPNRHFLWDGDNLLAELDGAGTGKVAEYSYWGMDRLHALIVGTTPYYGHQDARGNTQALTDSLPRRDYWYGAWGTLTGGGDGLPFNGADRARWKGALWASPEVDLYYMRNRWYEPRTGRFLSEDPNGLAGGINLYAYADGDPVNGSDPTGLCPEGTQWYAIVLILWDLETGEPISVRLLYTECRPTGGGSGRRGRSDRTGRDENAQTQNRRYTPLNRCPALNRSLLQQLSRQHALAVTEGLERGGIYEGPWSNVTMRMTGYNRTVGNVTIDFAAGALGYWHTHQQSGSGWVQGPSADDMRASRRSGAPELIQSADSLFILQNGQAVGCARRP